MSKRGGKRRNNNNINSASPTSYRQLHDARGANWQSAQLNSRLYIYYRNIITQMAMSRFRWINLPKTCDERYLEWVLTMEGCATIAFPPKMRGTFLSLKAADNGRPNMYGIASSWVAIGDNGTRFNCDRNNGVLIYDNQTRYPIMSGIDLYANELTHLRMTKRMNRLHQQIPFILKGPQEKKQDMVRKTTVHAVYDRFAETGRFAAAKCNWKEGEPNRPHIFWDSDIAKWMEGAAYLTHLKRDPKLEKLIDETVDDFAAHQWEDGYLGTYYTMFPEEGRFTKRGNHELYCIGHIIEAAVAYYEATGKRKLLDVVCRAADCVEKHFKTEPDAAFKTPGHEEIELALVKLYRSSLPTGKRSSQSRSVR